MPFKNNNPGCCCTCVADADHVCLCSCLGPFPRHFYFDDDTGTTTLTYSGAVGSTAHKWTMSRTITADDTQCWSGGIHAGTCPTMGPRSVTYGYQLTLDCVAQTWRFELFCVLNTCLASEDPAYGRTMFGTVPDSPCQLGNYTPDVSNTHTVADKCAWQDGLPEFDLPTSIFGFPTPGGGGHFVILPP